MNNSTTKNRQALRDFIAESSLAFDMHTGNARPQCGTAGCVKGFAAVLWGEPFGEIQYISDEKFCNLLGLTEYQGRKLVYTGVNADFDLVTKDHALQMLDHLIATNEVMWPTISQSWKLTTSQPSQSGR